MRFKSLVMMVTAVVMNTSVHATNTVNLNNTVAKANVVMSGVINANHGYFEGNVVVTSDNITMSASTVKGSLKIKSPEKTPVLTLRSGTKIFGQVIFQGKPGIINKSADSIIKGKIINGEVKLPR